MIKKISRNKARSAAQKRVRAKVKGTSDRPRLNVYKSLTNVYAQVINDENGSVIVSASTLDKEVKNKASNILAASEIGTLVAKRLIEKNIKTVVFDRNGYIYHGKVKALADAAREAGLEF